MKKCYFLLSAVFALSITACNGGNPGKDSNNANFTPYKDPTMDVAFEKIDDTCMVPSYVKDYIDAMHDQEASIHYPNRVDSLYCNMTWAEAASQSDKDDGVTYDEDHSGGVDVCQMLRQGSAMPYKNIPIEIKWDKGDEDFSGAELAFWSNADMSDLRTVPVESSGASAKLPNLMRNTKYYYQLIVGDQASQMKNFVTDDYSRIISMGSVGNIRDMGGYRSSFGGRINQGLIFRGGEINPAAFTADGSSHSKNFDASEGSADQKVQQEVLQIGLELDLRTKSGSANKVDSGLAYDGDWIWENTYPNADKNSNDDGKAQYVRSAINAYDSFITDQNRKGEGDNAGRDLVGEIFNYFAKADQQHVYFHCWGGADRTGVTGFLLLGILGATYTDAIIDFELTTLCNNKRCHMHNSRNAHFPKFLKYFTSEYTFTRADENGEQQEHKYEFDADATLNVNATNLLLAMGVKLETIEQIRTIMIPGYKAGVTQEEEFENKGWQR